MKDRAITALVAISGFVMTLAVSSWRDGGLSGFRPDSVERQQTSGPPTHIPSLTGSLTTIPFAGPARTARGAQPPAPTPQPIHAAEMHAADAKQPIQHEVSAAAADEPPLMGATAPNANDAPAEPLSGEERELQREARLR